MTVHYLAFVLDKESRERLLAAVPAKFDQVRAHHITLSDDITSMSSAEVASKIESIDGNFYTAEHYIGEHVHAVAVRYRSMGVKLEKKFPHVTISYEAPSSSKDSNDLRFQEETKVENVQAFKLTGTFEVLERNA